MSSWAESRRNFSGDVRRIIFTPQQAFITTKVASLHVGEPALRIATSAFLEIHCASSTCICSWAMWKRTRVSGCMRLHQCQCFSVSSVTAAPNPCARRTNWIKTLCLGCSPSEGFDHLFMSTLEIKLFEASGQVWLWIRSCIQLPFPPWRASGWLLLASLWFCSDPLCSRWHHTGFGLWVLKTRLETAVKVRTLVSGVASKGSLKLCFIN